MKKLRLAHLYLGVFFTPMLLFYLVSGWYQTFNPNRNKGLGEQLDWIGRLRSVHVDQVYPKEDVMKFAPQGFRLLVAVMCAAVLAAIVIGLILAFRTVRAKWLVWGSLVLGILIPMLMLWLGQKKL